MTNQLSNDVLLNAVAQYVLPNPGNRTEGSTLFTLSDTEPVQFNLHYHNPLPNR